jgi:hypothetical protein
VSSLLSLSIPIHRDLLLGLPKAIRDALARLAKEQRVAELIAQLELHLQLLDPDQELPELPEYDPESLPNMDWDEGVEVFHTWSKQDIWNYLGVDRHLPFFNERLDTLDGRHFWEDEALAVEIKRSGSRLEPRWHQLVGITKMLSNCFQGTPVLLMDDVGIGKTLQVVGLIALLAYYREYYSQHGRFPGKAGESSLHPDGFSSTHPPVGQEGWKWPGDSEDGNIPNSPFIVVVPTSLILQFADECRRYLEPQSFDLLPYTGTLAKRPTWWSTVFNASHHQLSRRIVIATTSVPYSLTLSIRFICLTLFQAIASDGDATFASFTSSSPANVFDHLSNYDSVGAIMTVFGKRWVLAIVDEAHTFRNVKRAYRAAIGLRGQADNFIAMTATPVQTRPMVIISNCIVPLL